MPQKFLIAAFAFAALTSAAIAQEPPSSAQCAAAWSAVASNETPANLQAFIASYGACAEADQARQDLVALAPVDDAIVPAEEPRGSGGALSGAIGGMPGRIIAPAAPSQPSPGYNAPGASVAYIPAGRILLRGQAMIAEGGGYGVILLRRGEEKNLAACQVFVRALGFTNTRDDGAPEQIDNTYVYRRPIYWPTLRNVSATRASDCPTMLAHYDYDRAAVMMARVRAAARQGPLMVVWRADGGSAGVFDYSELPPAELDRQFDRSLLSLAQSDQIWTPSFYQPDVFNRALRSLINSVTEPVKYATATLVNFSRPTLGLTR